ncbi:MAG TPA: queuosine salvage family protein [Solirubrobacterales bacterium]
MREETTNLCNRVRAACAWVAARAAAVSIDESTIEAYAAGLPAALDPPQADPATQIVEGDLELHAAFAICLDAINFGSGWWPTIRKRPGHSGYFTIAAAVTERFRDRGAWSAAELSGISAADVARVVGQDPEHPLMRDYAASLRDVGAHVSAEHGGSFAAVVEAAAGSAPALAGLLSEWDAFADVSTYEGQPVPFFKRAQLVPADLNRSGAVALGEEERLTAFADNLVPHVLRVDGILRLDPALERTIEAGELLEHGSAEEVELRACAVHAVEQLASLSEALSPAQVDYVLWTRGQAPRYKAIPRSRSRNTAY